MFYVYLVAGETVVLDGRVRKVMTFLTGLILMKVIIRAVITANSRRYWNRQSGGENECLYYYIHNIFVNIVPLEFKGVNHHFIL